MARTVICLRYFLLVYVILLGISGLVVSIGSGIFIYQLKEYYPLTPEGVCGPAITLLVMGLGTCLLGWCGWHVIEFTHRIQIICFAVALGLFAAIETSTGIWAVIKHEEIDTLRTPTLEMIFALAITDEKAIWDRMQLKLRCCGIDGPADYRITESVPWSCCDTTSLTSPGTAAGVCTTMYARGCLHPVVNRTRSILLHVFLLALCSVVLQVCGVISACFFARGIKESADRRRRELILSGQNVQAPPQPGTETEVDSRLVIKPPRTARRTKT